MVHVHAPSTLEMFHTGTIWMFGIGSGTAIGLFSATLILMSPKAPGARSLAQNIFFFYFEPMQFALGIATIRTISLQKSPPRE